MSTTKTIDCEQALRLLAAYLDEELGGSDRGDVEAHLERCRSCYSHAEFERLLKEKLTDLRRGDTAHGLETRIRGLLDGFTAGP